MNSYHEYLIGKVDQYKDDTSDIKIRICIIYCKHISNYDYLIVKNMNRYFNSNNIDDIILNIQEYERGRKIDQFLS